MPSPLPKLEEMTDILDIKPIFKMDLLWLWIAALGVLAAVLFLLYRRWKKKDRKPALPVPVPRKYSPREEALRALGELEGQRLLERGQFRKYYFRLSEILRIFLQDEFRMPAVDETTEEIRPHLRGSADLSEAEKSIVERMLGEMDFVKFAKFVPSHTEVSELLKGLRHFVSTAKASVDKPRAASGGAR